MQVAATATSTPHIAQTMFFREVENRRRPSHPKSSPIVGFRCFFRCVESAQPYSSAVPIQWMGNYQCRGGRIMEILRRVQRIWI
ncbi:hypothetical protein K1719_024340 [Acacia pycnantha]|nr:hypothetical protein K1719_024340 [Acacia pycnantha]